MEKTQNKWSVYIHTLPSSVSGKSNDMRYVGITSKEDPWDRWKSNGRGYSQNKYFWSAIKKYGWNNFEHEVIATKLSDVDAAQMEIALIKMYNSTDRRYGYNFSLGGDIVKGFHSGLSSATCIPVYEFDYFYHFVERFDSISAAAKKYNSSSGALEYAFTQPSTMYGSIWAKDEDVIDNGDGTYSLKETYKYNVGKNKKVVFAFDKNNNFLFYCLGAKAASERLGVSRKSVEYSLTDYSTTKTGYKFRRIEDVIGTDDGNFVLKLDKEKIQYEYKNK